MGKLKRHYWCNRCDGIHPKSMSCADHQCELDMRREPPSSVDAYTPVVETDCHHPLGALIRSPHLGRGGISCKCGAEWATGMRNGRTDQINREALRLTNGAYGKFGDNRLTYEQALKIVTPSTETD